MVFLCLCDIVYKLFVEVGLCFKDCLGGYLCIICIGLCLGDVVEMVYFELVDEEYVVM